MFEKKRFPLEENSQNYKFCSQNLIVPAHQFARNRTNCLKEASRHQHLTHHGAHHQTPDSRVNHDQTPGVGVFGRVGVSDAVQRFIRLNPRVHHHGRARAANRLRVAVVLRVYTAVFDHGPEEKVEKHRQREGFVEKKGRDRNVNIRRETRMYFNSSNSGGSSGGCASTRRYPLDQTVVTAG